jgi:hypothetical protein
MDCLELGMSNSRLGDRRKRVIVGERDEVADQIPDEFGGWWDKSGGTRIVGTAADPVLLVPQSSPMLLQPRPREETPVNPQQQVQGYGIPDPDMVDPEDHGVNVSEHFDRGDIGGIVPQVPGSFCSQ